MKLGKILTGLLLVAVGCMAPRGSALAGDEIMAGAVYEYKTWDCRIDGNHFTTTVRHRLTINSRGGDDYRGLSVWETPFVKLVDLKARVLDAGGREIYSRDKDDMTKSCGFGSISLYSDRCRYHTTFESEQYPYTIEYEYTLKGSSLFFWRGVNVQHYIPVWSFTYNLTVPHGFRFHSKVYGLDIKPDSDMVGGEDRYIWSGLLIPALEDIEYMPPGCNEGATIEFVADHFTLDDYQLDRCDWSEIGNWYNRLTADRYSLSSDPVNGGATAAAAKEIFDEVKKRVRYVSINVDLGGWQPHGAAFVQERGYGDCKDMSTLLISRLRAREIPAYPCLVLTKDNGLTDPDFPDFQFNHEIAMAVVEEDTVWLDCTWDECPYGDVPYLIENVDALVITERGGEIKRIAPSKAEDNRSVKHTHIYIGADRIFTLNAEKELTGNHAQYARKRLNSYDQDETRRYVNAVFDGAEKKYRIQSYDIRNLHDLDEPLVISIVAEGIKPLRKIGKTLYCDPFMLDEMNGYERADLEERTFPLKTYYPDWEEDRIIVTWDSSLACDSIATPGDDSLGLAIGELRLHSARYADSVVVEFIKVCHTYRIEVEQLADFETFRDLNKDIIHRYVKFLSSP